MKKALSLLLCAAMLAGLMGLPAMAAPAGEDGLVFEMDLSEYTNETPIVKNAVTGSAEGITLRNPDGNEMAQAIPMAALDSLNGETKYLDFSTVANDAFTNYGYINVGAEAAAPMMNQDAMTIEFWTNKYAKTNGRFDGAGAGGRLFTIGVENDPYQVESEIYLMDDGNARADFWNRFASREGGLGQFCTAPYDVKNNVNTWSHWVLEREWDAQNNTWSFKTYINGQLAKAYNLNDCTANEDGTVMTGGVKFDETGFGLTIGGMGVTWGSKNVYGGAISSFKVYNKVLDEAAIQQKYEDSTGSFVKLADTMNLVSPSADFDVMPFGGEIDITFDNYIDPATIDGNIMLLDSTGAPVVCNISLSEKYSKTAVLKYGSLREGEQYQLVISSGLTSMNGIAAPDKSFTLTVGTNTLAELDLTNATVGEPFDMTGSPFVFMSSGELNNTNDIVVKERNGVKYLEIKSSAGNEQDSYIKYQFGGSTTMDFTMEVKLKTSMSTGVRARGLRVWGEGFTNGYDHIINFPNTTSFSGNGFSTSSADAAGFSHLKFVFVMNPDTGKYQVQVTSDTDNNVNASFEYATNVSEIAILQYASAAMDSTIEVAQYKIYRNPTPEVLHTNFSELNEDNGMLEITFSDDMDPAGFGPSSIKLINNETGERVLTECYGYDANTRMATVDVYEYLDYGQDYRLEFSGIKTLTGFSVKPDTNLYTYKNSDLHIASNAFLNENGEEITTLTGASAVTAQVALENSTEFDKTAKVFAVVTGQDGAIKTAVMDEFMVTPYGATVELPITNYAPQAGDTLKLYVWDVVDAEQRAIMRAPIEITCE